jgi:L-2-hydroxycarboxylate dehydrogenase (NAD+)
VLTKTEAQDIRRVPAATLCAFLLDAMRACGLNEADAATVADAMLEADLTGSDAHGVFRLAGYVRQLKRGAMNPRATIKVVERSPATALIDGDQGMGHVVMTHAANLAVELARARGIGGSARAAPTMPAPAPSMPPSRCNTGWSESTARRRA